MGKHVTDYTLYRWRYPIGYGLIGLTITALLIVAGLSIPGGLSQAEMQSAIMSDSLSLSLDSFDPTAIVNLPYHLLQRASISTFGLSDISIKLPSLILGLASAAGILMLLRMWFRENVAVITSILIITTGQFVFVAQCGAESIMYIFLTVWLLVSALMISRKARLAGIWKIALFGIAAISLYTPLSFYILLALISAITLHPHLRFIVKRLSKPKLLLAGGCAALVTIPLAYAIFKNPSISLTLLGIPEQLPNIGANVTQLIKQYADFLTPNDNALMSPIYGLGSTILILLGILQLVTTKYTARSYITVAWIILLMPILIINPSLVGVTFVPVILLMAMGISTLLGNWYGLFPLNPYARIAGLVPIAVLIGGMIFSGVDRYMYGYLYAPQTAANFSHDLTLINSELSQKDRGATAIIVGIDEKPFYDVVSRHNNDIVISTALPIAQSSTSAIIVSKNAGVQLATPPLYRIITDSVSNNSDRFYIYKTEVK